MGEGSPVWPRCWPRFLRQPLEHQLRLLRQEDQGCPPDHISSRLPGRYILLGKCRWGKQQGYRCNHQCTDYPDQRLVMVINLECQLHQERGNQVDSRFSYPLWYQPFTRYCWPMYHHQGRWGYRYILRLQVGRFAEERQGRVDWYLLHSRRRNHRYSRCFKGPLRIRPFKPRRYLGLEQHRKLQELGLQRILQRSLRS